MDGYGWGLAPFFVILALAVTVICFNIYAGDLRPPEWLFPLKGRWLRYFFKGAGIFLLVLTSPFWIWFIGPLIAVAWISERIINAIYPAQSEPLPSAAPASPVTVRTEMCESVDATAPVSRDE